MRHLVNYKNVRNFMKKLSILTFCLFVIFSSFCFASDEDKEKTGIEPNLAVKGKNEVSNVFNPIENWFRRIFRIRPKPPACPNYFPNVENLILSSTEIVSNCSPQNKTCSNENKIIAVFTYAKDAEGDALMYKYEVSTGKIIGQGEKVLWDLTDVNPGTHIITASVDDGCGFCGKLMTKTVVIKGCLNCK